MVAARREGERAATVVTVPGGAWWRRFRLQLVALGTATFLAMAGVVGYFATRGSPPLLLGGTRSAGRATDSFHAFASDQTRVAAIAPGGPAPAASSSPALHKSLGGITSPDTSSATGQIVGPSIG